MTSCSYQIHVASTVVHDGPHEDNGRQHVGTNATNSPIASETENTPHFHLKGHLA